MFGKDKKPFPLLCQSTTASETFIVNNVIMLSYKLIDHFIPQGEVVVVPESTEPAELLSLFKGKFIVHKTTVRAI